jgi:hypothetical protein
MGGVSMLLRCVPPCVCSQLMPLHTKPCAFEIHISACEIIKVGCAKHVLASNAMCTAVCEFILGGCVVGTSYQCAAAIESALECASLPFGDLKLDMSATNVCEWSGL